MVWNFMKRPETIRDTVRTFRVYRYLCAREKVLVYPTGQQGVAAQREIGDLKVEPTDLDFLESERPRDQPSAQ